MKKNYLALLISILLLASILATPEIGIPAAILTLGLSIVLIVPLLYIFVGLLAMLPAVWFWDKSSYRRLLLFTGIIVSLVLWSLVTEVPKLIADTSFKQDLAARDEIAASHVKFGKPIGVEIHRRVTSNPNLYVRNGKSGKFYGSGPCFELCERLLTGGDVAWVRLIMTDDTYGEGRQQTRAMLKPGNSKVCNEVNSDFKMIERCALFTSYHGMSADLVIKLDEDVTNNNIKRLTAYQPKGYRTATAYINNNENERILFRYSQLFYERPTGMILYVYRIFSKPRGLEFIRELRASNPIDLAGAIEKIGLTLGPIRQRLPKSIGTENNIFIKSPPDAQDAAYVASLVATGQDGGAQYSNSFKQVVNDWHDRLRWKSKVSKDDRAIFCVTLADSRINKLLWKDQVIKKHSIACH